MLTWNYCIWAHKLKCSEFLFCDVYAIKYAEWCTHLVAVYNLGLPQYPSLELFVNLLAQIKETAHTSSTWKQDTYYLIYKICFKHKKQVWRLLNVSLSTFVYKWA